MDVTGILERAVRYAIYREWFESTRVGGDLSAEMAMFDRLEGELVEVLQPFTSDGLLRRDVLAEVWGGEPSDLRRRINQKLRPKRKRQVA